VKLNDPDFEVLTEEIREDCLQTRARIVKHKEEVSAKQLHIIASLIKYMFGPSFLGAKELLARYADELNEVEEDST